MAEALVNPNLLKWARKRRGLSTEEAAKKIQISSEKLKGVEEGKLHLTFNQLLKASEVYKRSPFFFYLEKEPEEAPLPDFRSRSEEYSGELDVVIREFRYLKRNMRHIADSLRMSFDYDFIGSEVEEDKILDKIQELLPYREEDLKGKKDNAVLNYWRERLSSLGIFVFQFGKVDRKVTRGFLLKETPFPVIALNRKDTHYARVFTIFHELCHLIMDNGGICDKEDMTEGKQIELLCNKVAGRYLIPDEIYEAEKGRMDQQRVKSLSKRLKVSYSVIAIRFGLSKKQIPKYQSKVSKKKWADYYTTYLNNYGKNFLDTLFKGVKSGVLEEHRAMEISGLTFRGFAYFEQKWERGEIS